MKVKFKNSNSGITKDQREVINSFVKLLQGQVPLSSDVTITLTDKHEDTRTTGVRLPKSRIKVLTKGRMLIDVLRTLAHEWVHEYQHQKMGLKDTDKIQDIGGPEENMCNILAGIFVKQFDKQNPDYRELIFGVE